MRATPCTAPADIYDRKVLADTVSCKCFVMRYPFAPNRRRTNLVPLCRACKVLRSCYLIYRKHAPLEIVLFPSS